MACDKEGAHLKCTNCTLILCDSCKEIIVKQECSRIMGLVSAVARWKLGYKRHDQSFADIKAGMEHHAEVRGGNPVWYTPLHLKTVVPHLAKESSCLQWELHCGDTGDSPSDLLTATLTVAHTPRWRKGAGKAVVEGAEGTGRHRQRGGGRWEGRRRRVWGRSTNQKVVGARFFVLTLLTFALDCWLATFVLLTARYFASLMASMLLVLSRAFMLMSPSYWLFLAHFLTRIFTEDCLYIDR